MRRVVSVVARRTPKPIGCAPIAPWYLRAGPYHVGPALAVTVSQQATGIQRTVRKAGHVKLGRPGQVFRVEPHFVQVRISPHGARTFATAVAFYLSRLRASLLHW
jgi:hypothetical protein